MNTTYSLTQTRFSLFGSEVLKILPMLKEGGIPASLVDQFMRSAASVGANYAEARGAESTADFLHKLQIALKECREAKHWLIMFKETPTVPQRAMAMLLGECDALCGILYQSVKTTRERLDKGQKG